MPISPRPPFASGTWRTFARLTVRGHVATVERSGTLYVVALNGSTQRAYDTWRNALAYAADLLASRPGA